MKNIVEIRHFHLFCGIGGGAKGFNAGEARVGNMEARYRCIGGVDVMPAVIADFNRVVGVRGTVMDLFDHQQYRDWHGNEPPAGWRAATPEDIRRAAGNERPHIVFTSPPCKGFSGLLSQTKSGTLKYQALNRLTLRGVWLTLEAWSDDPPEFFLLENVPRIQTRGEHLLDQIIQLLEKYGYATAETTHDCGELGGLAQTRKRFLLVARHREKVPPFLYEPDKKRLKSVGEVLGAFPLPGTGDGGAMHRLPNLEWRTWVRLALVKAGGDWRSLTDLRVEDGVLADYGIVPEREWYKGIMGVCRWDEHSATVTGHATATTGRFSVADPRWNGRHMFGQLGVKKWDETAGAVSGQSAVGGGRYSVADPRLSENLNRHYHLYRVIEWNKPANTITGATRPAGGGLSVADPRCNWSDNAHRNKLAVSQWDGPCGTVTGSRGPYSGGLCIADPRPKFTESRDAYVTGGHYGVVAWDANSRAVPGAACHDNGPWSVADPRSSAPVAEGAAEPVSLPSPGDRGDFIIYSLDGTRHRPFTTLELAALQSLVEPEEYLELEGLSDSAWRERIGNMVPPKAAKAIADVMGTTLLLAWSGETFMLSSTPVWVRPIAIALAVDNPFPRA